MGSKKKATSKKYSVKLSKRAEQQKNDIEDYIAFDQGQILNAIKVDYAFIKAFERIERNPYAYKICEEIASPNYVFRKASCMSWYNNLPNRRLGGFNH